MQLYASYIHRMYTPLYQINISWTTLKTVAFKILNEQRQGSNNLDKCQSLHTKHLFSELHSNEVQPVSGILIRHWTASDANIRSSNNQRNSAALKKCHHYTLDFRLQAQFIQWPSCISSAVTRTSTTMSKVQRDTRHCMHTYHVTIAATGRRGAYLTSHAAVC